MNRTDHAAGRIVLETDRLILRELTHEDFDALYDVLSDSDITRHYPYNFDEQRVKNWIARNIQRYQTDGFGLWAVILRESGQLIGDCGITMQSIHGVLLPEIGYHIHKKHQRKGYATEAAAECMRFAFEQLGFERIYSYMKYTNVPSYTVALKNGMRFIEEYDDPDNLITRVYAIDREEWMQRRESFFDSYCGLYCKDCQLRDTCGCKGCIASQGNSFHGRCDVAECAKGKSRRFCGECGEFPCQLLKSYAYDPEHGDSGQRIENCRTIKSALVRQARAGVEPVSVCGHHCSHCFMGQWCGGCRSKYSCCSFATLFADGRCPNVSCASDKGFEGCWECPELAGCTKGYYGRENEYAAKATALFAGRHGKDAYSKALARAISKGLEYPKELDECGSVQAALELLEEHRNEY